MSEVTEVFSKADTTGAGSPSAPSAASSAGNMGNFIPRPLLEEFVGLLRERSFVRSLFKTRTLTFQQLLLVLRYIIKVLRLLLLHKQI